METAWLFSQTWEDLLFAHWPVPARALRPLVPPAIDMDLFEGQAWLGIVAFRMTRTQALGKLPPRGLAPIPELNVRTYVKRGGDRGVWFISLDAASPFAVGLGRMLYGLAYHRARMIAACEDGRVHYLSVRGTAAFAGSYGPVGPSAPARPGSLEHFLVERYRLFALRAGRLLTAKVDHVPWPLQPAEARIELNTLAPAGIRLDGRPLLHFSRRIDALISAPGPIDSRRR